MRLRHALSAAAGALLIAVAVPNSASAATGTFTYEISPGVQAGLHDPDSGRCVNLFGTSDEEPASAPKNLTDATATVFLAPDCTGETFYVMNPGTSLGNRLKLRSVAFS